MLAVSGLFGQITAAGQEIARFCRQIGTDDALRPIAPAMVPAAKRLFGLRMADRQVIRSTVFRCADGRTLLCNYGANLPCGKANSDRHLPGAQSWCRTHPRADFIPQYMIPSGNIYRWHCAGGAPEIAGQAEEIDRRGFVARYWKALD